MLAVRKKLIEVALPLEEINAAAAREKSIRHGHPSTLHLWWARRPLASCRAVLFASIIDDPEQDGVPQPLLDRIDRLPIPHQYRPEWKGLSEAEQRRKKLFGFIAKLVTWEASNDPETLATARELIHAATDGNPPPVLDPFAGGGSIPLEAQRLGLEAHASDLNPVAVLINKAQIEIPPKFAGQPPVNPAARGAGGKDLHLWQGAQGLAEDVRYYGQWMRDEAEKRIGHLYPKAKLPKEYGGGEATVIAWIWARTVKSPNPAARGAHVPLVRSFALSTKKGKEAWVEPVVDAATMTYRFEVRTAQTHPGGKPREGTIGKRGGTCILTGAPLDLKYVRAEAMAGRMGARLMAVVAEGQRGRIYLGPTEDHEKAAAEAVPSWKPEGELVNNSRHMTPTVYGMTTWADLFTSRQLTTLSTFAELVGEAREKVKQDAAGSWLRMYSKADLAELRETGGEPCGESGHTPAEYADAVATYLSFLVSQVANHHSTVCSWNNVNTQMRSVFSRQALSMTWDFADSNTFSQSTGSYNNLFERMIKGFSSLGLAGSGFARVMDATKHGVSNRKALIVTDPPYYDNVPYADLSDFFYVWLRHTVGSVYPDLFGTMLTPKAPELIADPFRHGGKEESRQFFEQGMGQVFARMCQTAHPDYPITVIYAFKQSESDDTDDAGDDAPTSTVTASTGWETMLQALIGAGHQITGTWPMRTERAARTRAIDSNALASSIALVCRPRLDATTVVTRPEFQRALKRELPRALRDLQQGNVAPVDLQQSAIGPGMAVFSRYKSVLEASGKPMTVRTALQLINQILDEVLAEQEGTYDEATRWAVTWFSQYGFSEAPFGKADDLARAKNVAVEGLASDGIVRSGGGVVKLLAREELPADYDPAKDKRVTVWEATQYLARELDQKGIEAAGRLMARFRAAHPDMEVERARDLAYRLFDLSEKKKWSAEARPYNALVASWSDIEAQSQEPGAAGIAITGGLFDGAEE
jgi:Adenine-specific DNA methylase containing a Zn-ribbon